MFWSPNRSLNRVLSIALMCLFLMSQPVSARPQTAHSPGRPGQDATEAVEPTEAPPTEAPPTEAPPTENPTEPPPTEAPTEAPPTEAPTTEAPPTENPTEPPPTEAPTELPVITETPAATEPPTNVPTEAVTPEATTDPGVEPTAEVTAPAELTPDVTATVEVTPDATLEVTPEVTPDPVSRDGRVEGALLLPSGAPGAVESDDRVWIEVLARDAREAARLRPAIERLGGRYLTGHDRRMEFTFPPARLDDLNTLDGDFVVMRPQTGAPRLGSVVSEGVSVTGVDAWHGRGIVGRDVRVGVIDAGFVGLSSAETAGCLRETANFAPVYGFEDPRLGSHGTSVVEIICDMAPGVRVDAAQAFTLSGVSGAIDWLIDQDVHIISMSLGFEELGAGDGSGEMNTVVRRAFDAGILVINAAGNEHGDTWMGEYTPGTAAFSGEAPGEFHRFGAGSAQVDAINPLFENEPAACIGGRVVVDLVLRWADWNDERTGNASGQDYDLYLYTSTDGTAWQRATYFGTTIPVIAQGQQSQFRSLPPLERLSAEVACGSSTRLGVAIRRFGATTPQHMQLVARLGGALLHASEYSSLTTPADSADVLAVGAAELKPLPPFAHLGYPGLAEYSSRGPALGAGGEAPDPGSAPAKPELTAPTNARTSRSPAFNGTSAAAPHAAGFAALAFQMRRAEFDSLSGLERAERLRAHLINLYTRADNLPAPDDFCTASPRFCYGAGILTAASDWVLWNDTRVQENSPFIVRSGTGWTQTTTGDATYVYTGGGHGRIDFQVRFTEGVMLAYWQRPEFGEGATAEVLVNGSPVTSLVMYAPTPTFQTVTITQSNYPAWAIEQTHRVTVIPNDDGGLSLDFVQLVHRVLAQETRLALYGAWTTQTHSTASGGRYALTSVAGAGLGLHTPDRRIVVVYTGRPDGGILRAYVNGFLCESCFVRPNGAPSTDLDTFNGRGGTTGQEVALLDIPLSFGPGPYAVRLVNTGRRSAASRGTVVNIDAVRFPLGGGLIEPAGAAVQEAERGFYYALPLHATWSVINTPAASGGRMWSTTTPGADFRFAATDRYITVYTMNSTTGGILEVWVNGQRCVECGEIDTYAPTTLYRVPHGFVIPEAVYGASPIQQIALRNSGRRNLSSTGATTAIDRLEIFNVGAFLPLRLYNLSASQPRSGYFSLHAGAVISRAVGALSDEVYLFSTRSQTPVYSFFSASRRFTLLLGRGPSGGRVYVEAHLPDGNWLRVAETDTFANAVIWRWAFNVALPDTVPVGVNELRVGVESMGANNTGYFDGLLIDDYERLIPYGYDTLPRDAYGSSALMFAGAGWQAAPQPAESLSGVERRTNTLGASVQFTHPAGGPVYLVISRRPDGGVADLYINGARLGEISFYAPTPQRRETLTIELPAGTTLPALIELRVTPRRTPGSTGRYLYFDAVLRPNEPLPAHPINNTNMRQDNSGELDFFGASWTTVRSTRTHTIDPLNGTLRVTSASSGGVRFRLSGTNRFVVISSEGRSRGWAEVYVNGLPCRACVDAGGRKSDLIDQFYWSSTYRVPHIVVIPSAIFGPPPYVVELRTTNRRSPGSTAYGFDIDAITPFEHGVIDWGPSYVVQSYGAPGSAGWENVGAALALGGRYARTSAVSAYWVIEPTARELVILRTVGPNGGSADIYISAAWVDDPATPENDPQPIMVLCAECGRMNNYAAYTRYQMPFGLVIPDRFQPDADGRYRIHIVNTGTRPAGSRGTELTIDGFIFP